MLPQEVISKKRDGSALDRNEIQNFVDGLVDKNWSDAQVSALAMAIFLKGMNLEERAQLTQSMAQSGDTLSWEAFNLDGPILDKHSTGGVGDKVSLIVGALVAAAGGYMPKMSGPGLGHTGGTVDKMAAIPGYQVAPSQDLFRTCVRENGFALVGQTGSLAPADKRLYAIRDITGTIESIDLIASSILSKKFAVSPDVLVLDVKAGSGAFMDTVEKASALAHALVDIANASGVRTSALVTDMNQVLGDTVGNGLEVLEAVEFLKGTHQEPRLKEVCLSLTEQLLRTAHLGADVEQLLDSGQAAERFARMVTTLGGPKDLVERPDHHLADSAVKKEILSAETDGFLSIADTKELGLALVELGGGRRQASDKIDPAVGLVMRARVGGQITKDATLIEMHHRNSAGLEAAKQRVAKVLSIKDKAPDKTETILATIS